MRILHICLACFYVEGMHYQENLLPKQHKNMGHEVSIIASDYSFDCNGNYVQKKEKKYKNSYDIDVHVLTYNQNKITQILRKYKGLYEKIDEINPDIIFVHGPQSVSLLDIIKYKKKNPKIKIYVDQHGDYYNSSVNGYKRFILHKIIYKHYIKKSIRFVERFWGTTPWRKQYLEDVYSIPEKKTGLLVMGGDDDCIDFNMKSNFRKSIMEKYDISDEDFLIVTGGKIDKTKNIHLLMEAVVKMDFSHVKLIVFGEPKDDIKAVINELKDNPKINCIGWIKAQEAYNYFLAADLVVFPGTHSVLWEQACACGTPCVVKHWDGMHHVDLGGNCKFLYKDSADEIKILIEDIVNDKKKYDEMKSVAVEKCIKEFSYAQIAKRAIGID